MMTFSPFWMVYRSGATGQAPVKTHPTYEDAIAEAKRIAAMCNSQVFVLQAVKAVQAKKQFDEFEPASPHATQAELTEMRDAR